MDTGFNLRQVLAVASVHPFYRDDVEYPPSPEEVRRITEENREDQDVDLSVIPLATKETLKNPISRLSSDRSPKNTFGVSSYIGITGGGSGGLPMIFATDAAENRRHRAAAGILARTCKIVEPGDLVMEIHISGGLYRALDLMTEILENAGGSVLCAGTISTAKVIEYIMHFQANVVCGDGSQVLSLANVVLSLPAERRSQINIRKVIYTSETLNREQKSVISAAFDNSPIFSIMGSAEAGAWGIGNPIITGDPDDDGVDFIYDTRMMKVEILPPSVLDNPASLLDEAKQFRTPPTLPDGEKGIIIQTSLSRLRNPLLRYVTGDMGSVRPFPETSSLGIPSAEAEHLRIIRLYGRDRRFSFEWFAEMFQFQNLKALLQTKGWGILQWQIILEPATNTITRLEVRLYRSNIDEGEPIVSEDAIEAGLKRFFVVHDDYNNVEHFRVVFAASLDEFEKSSTGGKIMNFVDRTKTQT